MRPRLEETDTDLALAAVELAVKWGIKPAARALRLARNTVRAVAYRQDAMWAVRTGAYRRNAWRKLNRCLGLPVESRTADAVWRAYAKGQCLPEVAALSGVIFGIPIDERTLRNFRRRNPAVFAALRQEFAAKHRRETDKAD